MLYSELGSRTAKGGFANEHAVCDKINNWKKDIEAQLWLKIMGYNIEQLTEVQAFQISASINKEILIQCGIEEDFEITKKFKKADIQIRVLIKVGDIYNIENLSLKKANTGANFNHIDRRWVDFYQEMWGFNDEIVLWLKLFTGEFEPKNYKKVLKNFKNLIDNRRVFISEMTKEIQQKIITFFERNKILIVSDVLKGRGGLSADWMLVTMFNPVDITTTWTLKNINTVMNYYGQGEVRLSLHGSLVIGRIFMQRKGGTGNPNQLQFKFSPLDLFNV
jgi:hypothetical protein